MGRGGVMEKQRIMNEVRAEGKDLACRGPAWEGKVLPLEMELDPDTQALNRREGERGVPMDIFGSIGS